MTKYAMYHDINQILCKKKIPKKSQSNCEVLKNFGWPKLNHIFISFKSCYFSSNCFFLFTSAYFWNLSLLFFIHGFYYYLTNYTKLKFQFNIIKWTLCIKLFFSKNESLNHAFTMLVCCL